VTIPHAHTWTLINAALRRYRCADPICNVIGYKRINGRGPIPYVCQHEFARPTLNRKHCGAPAVFVDIARTANRCADHVSAPPPVVVDARIATALGDCADEIINRLLDEELARN
jgi:hypothetical protein